MPLTSNNSSNGTGSGRHVGEDGARYIHDESLTMDTTLGWKLTCRCALADDGAGIRGEGVDDATDYDMTC